MTEICIKDRQLKMFCMLVSTDITDHQKFANEENDLHFFYLLLLCEYISLYVCFIFPQYLNYVDDKYIFFPLV